MPLYTFFRESTNEYRDVYYGMNDIKDYKGENGDELDWRREWTKPCANIDTHWDCRSEADFVNKSYNKKGSLGDLFEKSRELSEKRGEKDGGKDPLKEKYFKEQRKLRGGKSNYYELKEKTEKAKDKVIEI